MKPISLKPAALVLALGMSLIGLATAQSKPTPAQQKELDSARADVERAAEHLADLSSKYGDAGAQIRIERGVLRKPVIGVVLVPDEDAGAHIAAITPNSAAASAGLKSGDRIISINGQQINAVSGTARVDQSRDLLASGEAMAPIKLVYLRGGKNQSVVLTPKLTGVIAPEVRLEVIRMGTDDCKDGDCKLPVLAEAFRWNGLNLASIDDGLGHYFGTTNGVLLLSTGKDLAGLQAGDVIQKIDGKAVNSPRQAMEALRAQPASAKVRVDYMRDHKSANAVVAVPEALPFRIPPPPPPPPARPRAPMPPASPAPPVAPVPPPPPRGN